MRVAAALGLVVVAACGGTAELESVGGVRVATLDGLQRELADLRGRPVIVNFWATWCAPCVAELPDLRQAARALRAVGGELIGVAVECTAPGQSLDAALARLPGFVADHDVEHPVVLFRGADAGPLWRAFGLPGRLPSTIAIDAQGDVVARVGGRVDAAALDELVRAACGR